MFGGITSLNDVLVPKIKELFELSYFQAMLILTAFFTAYFIVSLPAASLVQKVGYMRGAIVGLLVMDGMNRSRGRQWEDDRLASRQLRSLPSIGIESQRRCFASH